MPPLSAGAQRVLDAAAELFANEDYASVSISAIAEQAGVSKANIYHHFSSKMALYYRVLERACGQSAELAAGQLSSLERSEDRLARFVAGHLENLLTHSSGATLVIRELLEECKNLHDIPDSAELTERDFDCNFSRVVALLREGQQRGEFRTQLDPSVIATALIGANILFLKGREVLARLPDANFVAQPERFVSMLMDVMLHGILSAPPERQASNDQD